jgi:hypothetical protein
MSDEVALRPVREDDLPMLEELTQDPEKTGEFEWFGWADLRHWRRGWDENGLITPDGGTLIVARGNQRLGLVNWRRQPITVPSSYCLGNRHHSVAALLPPFTPVHCSVGAGTTLVVL